MEVLQLACLEPDLAILDEIDSGACSRVRSQQHMNANLNAVNVRAQWCAAVVPRMRAVCSQDCCPDRVHACNIAPHAGLDVDAMRDVAAAVNALRQRRPDMALLIITHYRVGASISARIGPTHRIS